jgi:hypothetical protein
MNIRVGKVSDIQGAIHVDQYLTDYSLAYMQDSRNFMAGVASSNIPVQKESDKYVIYPPGYFWRDEAQVRPLGGRPVQVSYKIDSGQYLAEEWALEHTIDDRQRANADAPINLDLNATRLLTGKQMIRADRIWSQKFFQSGVWTNETSGLGDFTPFNDASSEPISVIDEYKDIMAQTTGMLPNTLIVGVNVKRALRSNPDITDRIKYTQTGIANDGLLASLFEVDNFRVARAVYNTALEGGTDDFQFISDPNAMLLAYIDPSPSLESPTAIGRFSWTGLIPGATNDMGGVINRGRDDRAYSDWFHNRQAFDLKQVAPDLAVFFANAVVPVSN